MHFAFVLAKHKPGLEATNGVSSVKNLLKFLVFDLRQHFSKMNF